MSAAVFTLTAQQARRIVANPCPGQNPMVRRLAWMALKSERGERVIQSRLPRATPHDSPPPGAA